MIEDEKMCEKVGKTYLFRSKIVSSDNGSGRRTLRWRNAPVGRISELASEEWAGGVNRHRLRLRGGVSLIADLKY